MITALRGLVARGNRRGVRLDSALRIIAAAESLRTASDSSLNGRAKEIRSRAQTGEPADRLASDGLAIGWEASRRWLGIEPHATQIAAAAAIVARPAIIEMATGEGKTLVTALGAMLHGALGRGCHVVTANAYLARRDAAFASRLLGPLGFRVAVIDGESPSEERRAAYECDITYATARDLGFDYLRDRLAIERGERPVQRPPHAALVDEADAVLIDDAATPMILSRQRPMSTGEPQRRAWMRKAAAALQSGVDFLLNEDRSSVQLTVAGRRRVFASPRPPEARSTAPDELLDGVRDALIAQHLMDRDLHYTLDSKSELAIIDGATGRLAAGRKWRSGLHQAIELECDAAPSDPTSTVARCTVQKFFRRYPNLAGLTGSARLAATEFGRVYDRVVIQTPTHLPTQRRGLVPRVFASADAKLAAICDDILERRRTAVLIGTPTVKASERMSQALRVRGVDHVVLNCRNEHEEAAVVARAGAVGRVTVATNMAGRGTSIAVDPAVLEAGGLHVVVSEPHANRRLDRQLIGRTARQGQPGSHQSFAALDDDIAKAISGRLRRRLSRLAEANGELPSRCYRWFRVAQVAQEKAASRVRSELLRQEDSRDRVCRDAGLDPHLEIAE